MELPDFPRQLFHHHHQILYLFPPFHWLESMVDPQLLKAAVSEQKQFTLQIQNYISRKNISKNVHQIVYIQNQIFQKFRIFFRNKFIKLISSGPQTSLMLQVNNWVQL